MDKRKQRLVQAAEACLLEAFHLMSKADDLLFDAGMQNSNPHWCDELRRTRSEVLTKQVQLRRYVQVAEVFGDTGAEHRS